MFAWCTSWCVTLTGERDNTAGAWPCGERNSQAGFARLHARCRYMWSNRDRPSGWLEALRSLVLGASPAGNAPARHAAACAVRLGCSYSIHRSVLPLRHARPRTCKPAAANTNTNMNGVAPPLHDARQVVCLERRAVRCTASDRTPLLVEPKPLGAMRGEIAPGLCRPPLKAAPRVVQHHGAIR